MDPWTLAILIVCGIALALLAWGAIDELWQRRAPKSEPRETIPAADQCAVTDCELPWQTHRHGWQLCWGHYRQHAQKDGAA